MRTTLLIGVFAGAALFAASHSVQTTYVDGNLAGVTPNTAATLTVSGDAQITLHAGADDIAVPYEKIRHAELGAVKENSHQVAFYKKVWAWKSGKTQSQLLIVNFSNDQGEDRTMTLELAQSTAASVLETIDAHTGKKVASGKSHAQAKSKQAKDSGEWWGDDWWKTTRNADKWNKPAGSNAPDEQ